MEAEKLNMLLYSRSADKVLKTGDLEVASFLGDDDMNIDRETVKSFGEEWDKFDQFGEEEIKNAGDQYFDIVPVSVLENAANVLDLGCGSGRWTRYIAPKVGRVEAIDPNQNILKVASLNRDLTNVRFTQASVGAIPFNESSFDIIACLGVLHHVPNTAKALKDASGKLKTGGHFLLYLYYALDGRGILFKALFSLSTLYRRMISQMPGGAKRIVCDFIAIFVYMPFVLLARMLKSIGIGAYRNVPLSYYRDKSFNIIRNDALDRFGTPLEQRFTKAQITEMMENAGLTDLQFSDNEPYWHVLGTKR